MILAYRLKTTLIDLVRVLSRCIDHLFRRMPITLALSRRGRGDVPEGGFQTRPYDGYCEAISRSALITPRTGRATTGAARRRPSPGASHQGRTPITAILRRHQLIEPSESLKHKPYKRFEHERPNQLWQMDFKGHIPVVSGGRCHPLTVLDDHSRFSLGVRACADERTQTVHDHLTSIFSHYGMPNTILVDNGSPWGSDVDHPFTPLTVWLVQLGVRVVHSRPYHPQTLGKLERFHRSLKTELLQGSRYTGQTGQAAVSQAVLLSRFAYDSGLSLEDHPHPSPLPSRERGCARRRVSNPPLRWLLRGHNSGYPC